MESSGSSCLVTVGNFAFQKFRSFDVSKRIVDIVSKLPKNIVYSIVFQKGFGKDKKVLFKYTLTYNTFDYIVSYVCCFRNIIVWRKIVPLNTLSYGLSREFLEKNFLKLWYYVCKALLALRKNNIFHNDTVLDNIGIYNENFILFDFDGSNNYSYGCDYTRLKKSFHFYGIEIKEEIKGIHSVILYVSKKKNISLLDSFDFLESLKIL